MNNKNIAKTKYILKEIGEWALYIIIAFVIVIFINSEAFAITEVSGSSMEDTFEDGEKIILDKLTYKFTEPKVGDNIVFLQGETKEGILDRLLTVAEDIRMKFQKNYRSNRLVKRVIATPGDEINIKEGKVYVNNELFNEEYIKGRTFESGIEYPIVVPEGQLFVMGDNRENSRDSRIFGLVDYKSVEGKVRYKIWPLGR